MVSGPRYGDYLLYSKHHDSDRVSAPLRYGDYNEPLRSDVAPSSGSMLRVPEVVPSLSYQTASPVSWCIFTSCSFPTNNWDSSRLQHTLRTVQIHRRLRGHRLMPRKKAPSITPRMSHIPRATAVRQPGPMSKVVLFLANTWTYALSRRFRP